MECDDVLLTPPVHYNTGIYPPCEGYGLPVWSDFKGFDPIKWKKEFLDYEFLYNPASFLNLTGKKWATFRKNIRKWVNKHPNCEYKDLSTIPSNEVLDVLSQWLTTKQEEIYDDGVMLLYLTEGDNRRALFENGELLAINVWDENPIFVNYRYCVCKPEPYLSEYARYRFFTDPYILSKNKLVNDGGVLDKESLLFFKKRLNPVSIRKVYSWRTENE